MRSYPSQFSSRRVRASRVLAALAIGATSLVALPASPAGATTIGGLEPLVYTEGDGKVPVAPNATITESGSFADGYVEFSIAGASATESLSLPTSEAPDPTVDAISTVGSAVYLGLGGGDYKQIGTIDSTKNGQAGVPLRINFSAALPNADFSGGTTGSGNAMTPTGWTVNRNYVELGALASKSQSRDVTTTGSGPYTVSGPGYSFETDFNYGSLAKAAWAKESTQRGTTSGTHYSSVVAHDGHDSAPRLWFSGQCVSPNAGTYCSAFGPEAYSSAFEAKAGDDLAFDWTAQNGSDHYEVYGYLVNQDTNAVTELMYGRGALQSWKTTASTIPADGTYKFRFVAGSYDKTGGYAIGASLYIDNVRVLSSDASAAVAQAITRKVEYEDTSDNPPGNRTIEVETATAGGTPTSGEVPATITPVDDAPVIGTTVAPVFTNTMANDTFANSTGTVPAVDPESDPMTYDLDGATPGSTTIGAVTYDRSKAGTYGTMYLETATGKWAFVPDASAINLRLTNDIEAFGVTATAKGLVGNGSIPIAISVPPSVTNLPSTLSAVGGDESGQLSWVAPSWLGGSDISGYKVEVSTDGDSWSTAIADTGSDATAATVTGLTNGVEYHFRVSAINDSGTSAPSTTDTATPLSVPEAPANTAVVAGNASGLLTWDAPADNGGTPVTGYKVEVSTDGVSWTTFAANTGTTVTELLVTGLTNGAKASFRVSAINAVGNGPASSMVSGTPRTNPTAPRNPALTPGDKWAVLSWDAPLSDGGSAITGYKIETSPDGENWTVAVADTGTTDTERLLGGLTNGTPIHARVTAINGVGVSPVSDDAVTVPRTVPGAPAITSITPGNRLAVVAFTPPLDNGGSAITGYEYSLDGGKTWTSAGTGLGKGPFTLHGLPNDKAASIQLRAVNAAGAGTASSAKSVTPKLGTVIPQGVPSPPLKDNGSHLAVNGVETTTTVSKAADTPGSTAPAGTIRVEGGDVVVEMVGLDSSGDPVGAETEGAMTIVSGASTTISGSGFQPGSEVDVWLVDGEILLGTVTVGADGTFSATLPIPDGIDVGSDTIQLNGVGNDGLDRNLSMAVMVLGANEQSAAPAAPLALTGGIRADLAFLALGFVIIGDRMRRTARTRP